MRNSRMNAALAMLIAMGMMANPANRFKQQKDELEGVDIDKEMELIRQKKSCLSARQRRMVEYRYEQSHKEGK